MNFLRWYLSQYDLGPFKSHNHYLAIFVLAIPKSWYVLLVVTFCQVAIITQQSKITKQDKNSQCNSPYRQIQQKTLGQSGSASQKVILLAQYSVSPCSFVTALSPEAQTVTFIRMLGFSVLVQFFHRVARGLSAQPSPRKGKQKNIVKPCNLVSYNRQIFPN